jgi:hypothetical protein
MTITIMKTPLFEIKEAHGLAVHELPESYHPGRACRPHSSNPQFHSETAGPVKSSPAKGFGKAAGEGDGHGKYLAEFGLGPLYTLMQ